MISQGTIRLSIAERSRTPSGPLFEWHLVSVMVWAMSSKRPITLSVAGQKLALRTDADEGYVARLAEFVDTRVKETAAARGGVASYDVALLTALNIADELFRERAARAGLREGVRERARALRKTLEDAAPTRTKAK